MTGRLSPDDLDRTTAPEQARQFADELDLSLEVSEKAVAYADEYGLNGSGNRSPRSVAAGAVYFSAFLCKEKRTQAKVSEVAGVSDVTIREAYRDIAEAEGFDVGRDSEQDEGTGKVPRMIDRLRGRVTSWRGRVRR